MIRRFAPVVALVSLALASDSVAPLGTYTETERKQWAFVKRATPPCPRSRRAADKAWVKNPVDAFILSKLQKEGLKPSPPADRATLLRRVYFDLIGLPPTPAEMAAFLDRQVARRLLRRSSRSCWPARTTASAGASTGSTWSASPRPTATSTIPTAATPGGTATT